MYFLQVRVGSLSDPVDLPGLAHFLEHMLFYSSAKYPQEDEYSRFIAEKGGHTNAYTSNESTQYHFDVAWDALPEALDRFAQFFIAPLISEDGVEREVNAVDSEHGKNLNADAWKRLQLWKSTSNPTHPFSRFSTGNLDTLLTRPKSKGVSVHARVREFYDTQYSSSLMKLAVLGRHSLDELESLVRENFGPVVNKSLKPSTFATDAITAEQIGTLIRMVPEREGHAVEIQWPTLSEQAHYKAAPCAYVSHLLGHEGTGSAFAALKAKGWATGLTAGEAATSFSSLTFFMVRIELTDEGHRRLPDVIAVIFRYLGILRGEGGVSERVWREAQALSRLKFDYRDKLNPYTYVSSLAHAMQIYALQDLLEATYNVPLEYKPELITQVLADLTPTNARVLWSSKTLAPECTRQEPWYGTLYAEDPIPSEWLAQWAGKSSSSDNADVPALHLPEPNEFVPSDFSLAEAASRTPRLVHDVPAWCLWLRPDPTFKTPKAVVYLQLHLPEAYTSPTAAVLTQLYAKLANDALSEVTYPADLAGLHFGLRSSAAGVLISLSGYWHTLPRLATVVLETALGLNISADRFTVVKEKLAKDFANMRFEQPYQVALYEMSVALEAKRWHVLDYQDVLPELTVDDVRAFLPRLFDRCRIEAYSAGNLPGSAAEVLVTSVQSLLKERCASTPPLASQSHEMRVVRMPPGKRVLLRRPGPNPANDNSALVVAFQIGPDSLRTNALAQLVAHIGKRDAFYQLRTVEQLGYLTFFCEYSTLTVRNLAFILQSSVKSAAYLQARVDAFIPLLGERLEKMSVEEFGGHVDELAKAKLERPKRLREVAARDWREIDDGTGRFAREEDEVAELRSLTLQDLVDFYVHHVIKSSTRRMMTVRIEATPPGEEYGTTTIVQGGGEGETGEVGFNSQEIEAVDDVYQWKRAQELYPSSR